MFDAWDAPCRQGRSAVQAMAEAWFQALGDERVAVNFSELRQDTAAGMACAGGVATCRALSPSGSALRSMANRFTVVLQQEAAGWKVAHEHTSVPVDFVSRQALPLAPPDRAG